MGRHGDTVWHLHGAVALPGERFDRTTIREWRAGRKAPRSATSLAGLARMERRYLLPAGYFQAKLPHRSRAVIGHAASITVSPAEPRRLAWHLPDDFDARPRRERDEILDWVRRVAVSGSTDYRRFQADALRQRYAVRFPSLTGGRALLVGDEDEGHGDDVERELAAGNVDAPPELSAEVEALVRFKTATPTAIGYQRVGVWTDITAMQKIERLGLLFGALAASPRGPVAGRGAPLGSLGLGLLAFRRCGTGTSSGGSGGAACAPRGR